MPASSTIPRHAAMQKNHNLSTALLNEIFSFLVELSPDIQNLAEELPTGLPSHPQTCCNPLQIMKCLKIFGFICVVKFV